jgi:radical SAM superfamily enzyme YgiQ (UPF0313 family)
MMNNILFSHSYFLRFDPKQWATGQPYAPLGTLYAAALLRENGYKVSLFDTMFAHGPDEVLPYLERERPAFFVLYDDGFNYLTKMCLTNMREAAFRMCRLARARGCTVIVSGSDSTDHYIEYLQEGADFVLIGEAEQSLLELVKGIEKGVIDFAGLPGIAYLHNGQPVKTPARPVMRDLDALPLPAWDLVNIDPYRQMWLQHKGYFSINMGTTRGCPFKCNWCAKPIYGNRYNSRSPEHVMKELKWLYDNYRFDHIWFCDDIFGLKPGWVSRFADLAEQQTFRFSFKIQSRADLLVQENYVAALARAGCENVWMGAESGSQKILDAMDKGTTIAQIHTATQLLRTHGIRPAFFIQFGYLGETKEDIDKTIHMINSLLPDELGISVSYPLPGTVFYEKVKTQLNEKANWTDSDELLVMFRNNYSPKFYKQLHRYVHKSYRKHLALQKLRQVMAHPRMLTPASFKKAASIAWYLPAAFFARRKLDVLEKLPVP